MINRSKPHNGLADFTVARRKRKPDFFDVAHKAINWVPIEKFLYNKLNRKANVVGNPAYLALLMFKILLLQKWYKLSDPAMTATAISRSGCAKRRKPVLSFFANFVLTIVWSLSLMFFPSVRRCKI